MSTTRIAQTYIPPFPEDTPFWNPSEPKGTPYVPPAPAPSVATDRPRHEGVVPTPPTMTWVAPGTPLPTLAERPNHINLNATQYNDYCTERRALQTEQQPTHGNQAPALRSRVNAFGEGEPRIAINSQVYNGVFRTPWYFSPAMREEAIQTHLKNYCVESDPKVILGYGTARPEMMDARLAQLTRRQIQSLTFMPS